jgi:hypothetical protein
MQRYNPTAHQTLSLYPNLGTYRKTLGKDPLLPHVVELDNLKIYCVMSARR